MNRVYSYSCGSSGIRQALLKFVGQELESRIKMLLLNTTQKKVTCLTVTRVTRQWQHFSSERMPKICTHPQQIWNPWCSDRIWHSRLCLQDIPSCKISSMQLLDKWV